ncbi:SDR family oxidoreductase [Siminovitchia fortis]|uniref:SDR family oxidoreductase n=1 Tax=Siminovitchia fortis TaxID=254758 RepID=A0A443J3K5_9BACI|nr:SDR family oxidoreductase [Siminovitchia fortis]RWR15054.1 SDR family oxidoreductase [Siminovitchia fortis]WHY82809.1 SDR family oxidoreductase [Siminovitchia fortis]
MRKNERLKGKTVVITGASGGLGEQTAYRCAASGANLVLLSRNVKKLEEMAESIREKYGVSSLALKLDISRHEDIPAVFRAIFEKAGHIDVLVNNAGYGIFAEAKDVTPADVEGMFAVNVVGLIVCTKEVIPSMRKRKSGHIINISSQAGKLATPKSSVYSATKHAVLGYTNSLRMELAGDGVFVTAVNPGPMATNFFDLADPSGNYVKNLGRHILSTEKVAEKVVDAMLTNRREINLPGWMNAGSILYAIFPRLVERLGKKAFFKK